MTLSSSYTNSQSPTSQQRFHLTNLFNPSVKEYINEGADVIRGLTQAQKILPPRYFYDDHGSQLFEQICTLPEYYPTRTEAGILQQYSTDIAKQTGTTELIELGSGSSTKTRFLLDAYQHLGYALRYVPIDVSAGILESSAKQLLKDYPTLQISGIVGTYELAMQQLVSTPFATRTLLFLGSTLGNFNQAECDCFFGDIAETLDEGDYFVLGIDLQKSIDILEAAYNDQQGVTAAFNLNMLTHLNYQFKGNFNPDWFEHQAVYNPAKNQIEMYLISQRSHCVNLEKLGLKVAFNEGETILTEISRKFDITQIAQYLSQWGLKTIHVYHDSQQWFGVLLCQMLEKG